MNTDNTELDNVLDDIKNDSTAPVSTGQTDSGLQFEETPVQATTSTTEESSVDEPPTYAPTPEVALPPVAESTYSPYSSTTPVVDTSAASGDLESIKKDALEELRPLVDHLDLPASEKFDTLLLIIRSTDDQSLIGAAHTVAKTIEDETKRAQALLDVIKEIDFFANQAK